MEEANCSSQSEKEKQEFRVQRLFVGAVGSCLLLSIALYNGYPTVFSDTGGYLLTGKFFIALAPFRAPGYAIFTRLTSLGVSAWFTIVTQSVMVVYVLHETCDYLIDGDRKFSDLFLLASICAMTALTSLPWLVSLLMPDVFAGVLFLSAFLLAFAKELNLIRRIALAAIFMVAAGAHASLLPIAVLFSATVVILNLFSRQPQASPSTSSALVWLVVPIIVAGVGTAALNRQMGLGFRVSPSSNSFLMARLFGNGLATDFLREYCPQRNFVSCRYLSSLPRTQEEFLFQHPLYLEIRGDEVEMEEIVRGTILAYPVRFAVSSAKETLLQLTSLRTGDEIRTYGAREWNSEVIPHVFPGDWQAFSNSRQHRDRLIPLADAAGKMDTAVFWLSVAISLYLAGTGRSGRINLFYYSALAYLLINAAFCATFAGVYDRYQSRVAWILPFCLTAYVYRMAREWKCSGSVEELDELEEPAN